MNTDTIIFVKLKDVENRLCTDELRRRLAVATMREWDYRDAGELRCRSDFQTFEDKRDFLYCVKKIVREIKDAGQITGDVVVDAEGGPLRNLACDTADTCEGPVTHIDEKGFIYCLTHGNQRKTTRRCRKLKPAELKRLRQGKRIAKY